MYRRRAIETIVTGGMSEPVIQALTSLLSAEESEAWLRIRAQAALGFMQRFDSATQTGLTDAFLQACEILGYDRVLTRAQVTEIHASLFAVGDCFGAAGIEERAGRARDSLRSVLIKLVDSAVGRPEMLQRAARAAAYLLAVTAQPGRNDLSRVLLQKLAGHPDPVTSDFSNWVLSFRFTADGKIRPLIAAAEFERPGSASYLFWNRSRRRTPAVSSPEADAGIRTPGSARYGTSRRAIGRARLAAAPVPACRWPTWDALLAARSPPGRARLRRRQSRGATGLSAGGSARHHLASPGAPGGGCHQLPAEPRPTLRVLTSTRLR